MLKKFLLSLCIIFFATICEAQITGTVFRDYNENGVFEPAPPLNEIPIAGVIINAYNATNVVIATTLSAANGTYSLPFTVPVRLEFEMGAPTACVDSSVDYTSFALAGDNVKFIPIATNNVDYGIHNPQDYQVTADPYVFITKFNRGDPLNPGTSQTAEAFYGFLYSSSAFAPTYTHTADSIGAVWGVAYSRQSKKVFTSAFMKRHSGYGILGSGGIYLLTPNGSSFSVNPFYDMDANGHRTRAASNAVPFGNGTSFTLNAAGTQATYLGPIDPLTGQPEGLGVIGINGAGGRGMTSSTSDQWNDPAAMEQVGKVGIGDIDISEDGKFLFVSNLYSRLVYRLELDNPFSPQSVIAVDSFALPAVPVNNGVLRLFGLAYHRGKLFIGAVATGENGGSNTVNGPTDLYAFVFEMQNPLSTAPLVNPIPVITFPLNYQKGWVFGPGTSNEWFPWNNNTSVPFGGEKQLPTPMLSDIEFTDDGSMILDFCDRTGHQITPSSYLNLSGTTFTGSVNIGGDILIAGFDCATGNYVLENNGSYTAQGVNYSSAGVGNGEGIGGGEFFYEENWVGSHQETSVGSCAVLRGRREVISSQMDPINAFSNGTKKFSTINGNLNGALTMAGSTEFGKGNSLGDIEVAGDAAILQIGNRVWEDANANGIQDPTETGIQDVTVELFADFDINGIPDGGALASTQTNNAGYFYFDNTNVVDGDPIVAGAQAGPVPRRNYLFRVGPADWAAGAGINDLFGKNITVIDIGGGGQPDVRDNDAFINNAIPMIDSVYTGNSGRNAHQYDFGFIPCPNIPPSDITLTCKDTVLPIGPAPVVGFTYQWSPGYGLSATNVAQPLASPSSTTTYTLTINKLCTTVFTAFVDVNPPEAEAGPPQILGCEKTSTVIGTPAIGGNTYSWSPGNTLNDSTLAQPTASPKNTTQYTLTVTGTNGCITKDYVTIDRDPCCARIVIPNTFSPNKDRLNDEFGVVIIENVQTFYLTIYNRYGERVFETEDPTVKWDGNYKNKVADVGTYYYYIKYNCQNFSQPRFLKGDISLVR